MSKRKDKQVGPMFEDRLKEEGIHEAVTNASIEHVLAWRLERTMKERDLTKRELARRRKTSPPRSAP